MIELFKWRVIQQALFIIFTLPIAIIFTFLGFITVGPRFAKEIAHDWIVAVDSIHKHKDDNK
jgi:hypothetical protein